MTYTIYKLINKTNGKTYTGCTEQFDIRIKTHFRLLKRNKHYNLSLQKDYNNGDHFGFIQITTLSDRKSALKAEAKNIDKGSTYNINIAIIREGYANGWIKKSVLKKIDANINLKGRLCVAMNVTYPSVENRLRANSIYLTLAAALKVIREELNLTNDQILETAA